MIGSRKLALFTAALLWFGAGHLFNTWGVWSNPLDRIQGPAYENLMFLWNLGWVNYALQQGSLGMWVTSLFYPDGFFFPFHSHTYLYGLLGWGASPILPDGLPGMVLFYNLIQLFSTVATGLLGMQVARELGVSRWTLRLLVGSVLAFSWFRMSAMSWHLNFVGTEWMVAGWVASLRGGRWLRVGRSGRAAWWGAFSGVALGAAWLNDSTLALYGWLLSLPSLVHWRPWSARGAASPGRSARFVPLGVAVALFLLVCGWMIAESVPFAGSRDYNFYTNLARTRLRENDVLNLFLPSGFHWALAAPADAIRARLDVKYNDPAYFGVAGLLLLVMALIGVAGGRSGKSLPVGTRHRTIWLLLGGAALFFIFYLGDSLQIAGRELFPLPGRVLRRLPLLTHLRFPHRWVWPMLLCVAPAGALAWQLLRGRRWGNWHGMTAVMLALVAILDGWVRPLDTAQVSELVSRPLCSAVRENFRRGGVVILPSLAGPFEDLKFQLACGFDVPVVGGHCARPPRHIEDIPWQGPHWKPEAGAWLQKHGIALAVLRENQDPAVWQKWLQQANRSVAGFVALDWKGNPIPVRDE